jgi:hypothetical protein
MCHAMLSRPCPLSYFFPQNLGIIPRLRKLAVMAQFFAAGFSAWHLGRSSAKVVPVCRRRIPHGDQNSARSGDSSRACAFSRRTFRLGAKGFALAREKTATAKPIRNRNCPIAQNIPHSARQYPGPGGDILKLREPGSDQTRHPRARACRSENGSVDAYMCPQHLYV